MEQLTLHHLARRLPYGLKMYQESLDSNDVFTWNLSGNNIDMGLEFRNKPIFHPLSDYQDINSKQMNDLNCDIIHQIEISEYAKSMIGYSQLSVGGLEIMLENHIQLDEPEGTWIDVNTLDVNPYE